MGDVLDKQDSLNFLIKSVFSLLDFMNIHLKFLVQISG